MYFKVTATLCIFGGTTSSITTRVSAFSLSSDCHRLANSKTTHSGTFTKMRWRRILRQSIKPHNSRMLLAHSSSSPCASLIVSQFFVSGHSYSKQRGPSNTKAANGKHARTCRDPSERWSIFIMGESYCSWQCAYRTATVGWVSNKFNRYARGLTG